MTGLIVFVVLASFGFVFGRIAERRHFASIHEREDKDEYQRLLVFTENKMPPGNWRAGVLVGGNVVISVDYFKTLAGSLRALFGGRIRGYESLLERGRREALLRMKEEALSRGAEMVINVRLETASISKGKGEQIGSVEVYAYGTALIE